MDLVVRRVAASIRQIHVLSSPSSRKLFGGLMLVTAVLYFMTPKICLSSLPQNSNQDKNYIDTEMAANERASKGRRLLPTKSNDAMFHDHIQPEHITESVVKDLRTFNTRNESENFGDDPTDFNALAPPEGKTDVLSAPITTMPGARPSTFVKVPPNVHAIPYFQPVDGDLHRNSMWVYSAYYDVTRSTRPMIRAFGISSVFTSVIFCHILEGGNRSLVKGYVQVLPESHQRVTNFMAAAFDCQLREGSVPEFVSFTLEETGNQVNLVPISYPAHQKYSFTVCHAAMFGPYNKTSQLIQSIEFNRALGSDHIFVYNFSISRNVDIILRKYQMEGLVTVIQWPLPVTTVWYYGQMAAINDCVYRNRNMSKYVVIQDIDEFIVPEFHRTWRELIQFVEEEYYNGRESTAEQEKCLGSITFESAPFTRHVPKTVSQATKQNFSISEEEEEFFTLNKIMPFIHFIRCEPFKFPSNSKTIIRPELVRIAAIHRTRSLVKGATYTVVNNQTAKVHHYSPCRKGDIMDTTILRYKDIVYPRLKKAFAYFATIMDNL